MATSILKSRTGGVLALLPLFLLASCAARNDSSGGTGSSELTRAEMADYATVHDAVQAKRSRWLQPRTPLLLSPSRTIVSEHVSGAVPVWVYRDGTRIGGPEFLRQIQVVEVSSVEYVDPRAAANRWGMNHDNGVILVTSRKSAEE